MWLGCIEEHRDYMTQGQSLEELEENFRDLYRARHILHGLAGPGHQRARGVDDRDRPGR